jgi:hypothetical protein
MGAYCAACGERFLSVEDFDIRHFLVEHLPHEVLHVDGKLARTLRLLFLRPGRLAVDHVEGRRQPFVSPLRLYLLMFLLHEFLVALTKGFGMTFAERVGGTDLFGVLTHLMSLRPDVDWRSGGLNERLREHGNWMSEMATLLIFLVVAVFQKLLFYRLHRSYLQHVALALNVAAFYLAVIVLGELLSLPFAARRSGEFLLYLQQIAGLTVLPLYWMLAIRRFYSIRTALAVPAAIIMTAVNSLAAIILSTTLYAIMIITA